MTIVPENIQHGKISLGGPRTGPPWPEQLDLTRSLAGIPRQNGYQNIRSVVKIQVSARSRSEAHLTQPHFARWLYRGKRPNWIAGLLNSFWAAVASAGITPNLMVTLEVTGRKSGRTLVLPVVPAYFEGQRYLISMLGDKVQWVLNVRAAGGKAVLRSGKRQPVHLEEVPSAERAPILKAYLQRAPGARPHIPVDRSAPLSEFEQVAADYPVFRIVPEA